MSEASRPSIAGGGTGGATLRPGFWRIASADPTRVAVIGADGSSTTYGELLAASRAIAHGLRSLEVQRGDGVSMVVPNHPAFFEILLAAMETGVYLTPVNSHLAAPEVEHVVVDSEAKVLVAHEALAEVCRLALKRSGLGPDRRFAVGTIEGFRPYAELHVQAQGPPPLRSPGGVMMYTSGTTGQPRGVRRPLPEGDPDDVYGDTAVVTSRGFGVPLGGGIHLVCGPLYHAGPFVGAVNSLHVGNTLLLMDRWTPEGFLALVDRYRVDSTQMVPTMFHQLVGLPDEVRLRYDVSSLRSVFHTGSPCPVDVKQRLMGWWGPVVYETYGGTEGAATIATPKRWLERPGTVGKAIHDVTVHILDEEGNEAPTGRPGDIWIETRRGSPTEYFNDPGKTSRMRRGTMVTLGDIGYLDDDGYLFLCDRRIDMIISGGVNIYPAEIEAALLGAADVADAAVIGVPDDEWGEQVKAIVQLRAGVQADAEVEAALIAHCARLVARFKLPRSVDFVEQLPRLPNGKVEKRRLRDPYWADTNRAI